MTNLLVPPSRASRTFCLSSWRLPTINCPSTPTITTPGFFCVRLKPMCAPIGGSALRNEPARMRSAARLQHRDRRRVHNIVGGGAPRQVGNGARQTLQDRPDGLPVAQPLHQFVRYVPAVKGGEHHHV